MNNDPASPASDGRRRRGPGRPRLEIDLDTVVETARALIDERGYTNVTVEMVAEELGVSRASLYRAVPSKMHLVGLIFERGTTGLSDAVTAALAASSDPAEQIRSLIRLHTRSAVSMRRYMFVFFGGDELPEDVRRHWHEWSREYEALWAGSVATALERGVLPPGDVVITTRLLLGMCIWVSRWYRPADGVSEHDIAEHAIGLVGLSDTP